MAEDALVLDRAADSVLTSYVDLLRWANEKHGVPYGDMTLGMFKVWRGPGGLVPEEYFLYQLWDGDLYDDAARMSFVGAYKLVDVLHSGPGEPWQPILNDKNTATALLAGYGLPVPRTQAMRHAWKPVPGGERLESAEAVAAFLRDPAHYPTFGKPLASSRSIGVLDLVAYDAATDTVQRRIGEPVAVDDVVKEVESFADAGYLFQERMVPHPDVVKVVGDRIATVRVLAVATPEGPELVRASWKIPAGDSSADNLWRKGNMLGHIDLQTGRVDRVVMRTEMGFEEMFEHPDTGVDFDLELPLFHEMVQVVREAARVIGTCRLQGWDVALTAEGPVLVEVEGDGGSPVMTQLGRDTGLLAEPAIQGFLQRAAADAQAAKGRSRAQRRADAAGQLKRLTNK